MQHNTVVLDSLTSYRLWPRPLLIAKLPGSQQQEAFSASFRGLWTSEGNSQVLISVRELALCGAPHNANNAEGVFMQSAAE